MLIGAFAMLCALTLSTAPGAPAAGKSPEPPAPAERRAARQMSVGDLYSARAKRRMASFLRMRLLELRLRGLERAADVVEHRLTLDALLRSP